MPTNRSELKASPSLETSKIVEKLREMHANGEGGATTLGVADLLGRVSAPKEDGGASYADLHSLIAGFEAQMRVHSDSVDRRVETSAPPASIPVVTQATLFLQGTCNGQTGGKFICRNRLDHVVAIEMEIGTFKDSQGQTIEGVSLEVAGLEPALAPFEHRQLSCRLDLTASSPMPRGQLDGWVEFRLVGASALRLWIEVDLHD